jgi:hypothetical protein
MPNCEPIAYEGFYVYPIGTLPEPGQNAYGRHSTARYPPYINSGRGNLPCSESLLKSYYQDSEKSANSCPSLAEHIDNKGYLYFITWVNKTYIVFSPKRIVKLNQIIFAK